MTVHYQRTEIGYAPGFTDTWFSPKDEPEIVLAARYDNGFSPDLMTHPAALAHVAVARALYLDLLLNGTIDRFDAVKGYLRERYWGPEIRYEDAYDGTLKAQSRRLEAARQFGEWVVTTKKSIEILTGHIAHPLPE
ncbi:MAG: hypothetical protein HC927_02275 [Deltaproteobacteria bacterium]|nr:hypothetical protein [Deltaproteobacteria bacterium]